MECKNAAFRDTRDMLYFSIHTVVFCNIFLICLPKIHVGMCCAYVDLTVGHTRSMPWTKYINGSWDLTLTLLFCQVTEGLKLWI